MQHEAGAIPPSCQAGDTRPCWGLVVGGRLFAPSPLPLGVAAQKHLFTCLHWLLLGPNCKVRQQRAGFVSAPCGAAYFLLALYSTCNLKIYLFTISAAEMVGLPVFSLKPASSPGSFCYLPNFFYFDSIFLTLHNPCENCKYSKSIPSCFLLWCLLTLSLLFHAALSKYLQPIFCHHQIVCF